jgi:hypothetical protein
VPFWNAAQTVLEEPGAEAPWNAGALVGPGRPEDDLAVVPFWNAARTAQEELGAVAPRDDPFLGWLLQAEPPQGAHWRREKGEVVAEATLTEQDLTFVALPTPQTHSDLLEYLSEFERWWEALDAQLTGEVAKEEPSQVPMAGVTRAEKRFMAQTGYGMQRRRGVTGIESGPVKAMDPTYKEVRVKGWVFLAVLGGAIDGVQQPAVRTWRTHTKGLFRRFLGPYAPPRERHAAGLATLCTLRQKACRPTPRVPDWLEALMQRHVVNFARFMRDVQSTPRSVPRGRGHPQVPAVCIEDHGSKRSRLRIQEHFEGQDVESKVESATEPNTGSYRSIFEYTKSNKQEARDKRGVCRTYEAPAPHMVVLRQRMWGPYCALFYRGWMCVKGSTLLGRATELGTLALEHDNKSITGDVEGSDTSFREKQAARAALARSILFSQPERMRMRRPGAPVKTRSRAVRAQTVGLHPSGEAGNWAENMSNYGPIYIGGIRSLLGYNVYTESSKIRLKLEGDDSIIISRHLTEEHALLLRRWVLANGFISQQTLARVIANMPGPSALADFCSTHVGQGPAGWITGPVQPRGVCRLLATARDHRSYLSLLAAKCASALCLSPTGGIHVAVAQRLASKLDPRLVLSDDLDVHFDNPAVTLPDIRAAWRVLSQCDHGLHEWEFESVVWWRARPASWLQGHAERARSKMGLAEEAEWWLQTDSLLDDAFCRKKGGAPR